MSITEKSFFFIILLYVLTLLASCQPTEENATRIPDEVFVPVKIVFFEDHTPSTESQSIPELSINDIKPILERVVLTTGDVALGIISDESDIQLHRVRIYQKPDKPESSTNKNALLRLKEDSKNKKQFDEYKVALRDWDQRTKQDVSSWIMRAESLLTKKVKARDTDFVGAVNRAVHFLEEDNNVWEEKPLKILFIISDCKDTVGHDPLNIPDDVHIILVTDSYNRDSLIEYNAKPFENILPAIDHTLSLINSYQKNNDDKENS